jgi:ABC-type multidrug transport system fused ATPase/permease subunit
MKNVTLEQVIQAAKIAHADEFIQELPQQYETVIGERGTALSGGQRQRLSIARAILRNPQILILDEATSALDNESELLVQQALENLLKTRTAIIIAHRLNTIKNANRILFIKEGRITESGTHDQLLSLKGDYFRYYSLQNING